MALPQLSGVARAVSKRRTPSGGPTSSWWLLAATLLALWLLWPAVVFSLVAFGKPSDNTFQRAGQFGDLFGALNALVSSLTLVCLVYTLWQQQRDLSDTRDALRRSLNMQGLLEVRQVLQADDVRQSRGHVQDVNFPDDPNVWTKQDWDHVERVCQTFEFAGILVQSGLLEEELVSTTWGRPIEQCWQKVRQIQHNTKRGYALPYSHFQYLAERYQQRQAKTADS
jgi:hypothetical protein